MKLLKSIRMSLILTFLLIIINASSVASVDRNVDLDIGVEVGERYEFKINNFEDRNYNVEEFIIIQDYNWEDLEYDLTEDTFTITISRIETLSSESICFVDGDDCIYYTPEIYVDLTSGTSNITGIVSLSATPFGELITTTDWELVEARIMEPLGGSDGFLEVNKEEISFNKDGNKVTIMLDVNATFVVPSNEDLPFPYKSLAIKGTSIYDAETGVIQSNYEEINFAFSNGSVSSEIIDISNITPNGDSGYSLSIPVLTFNQTIFCLLTLSLIYYRKRV